MIPKVYFSSTKAQLTFPEATAHGILIRKCFFRCFSDASSSKTPGSRSGNPCPFSNTPTKTPELKHVPKLPFFGSMIPAHSGIPGYSPHKIYERDRTMRQLYGEFYTEGFPMMGRGLFGEAVFIEDPVEMLKVIRAEGVHPSGLLNNAWNFIQVLRDDKSALIDGKDNGLFGTGERWKRQRTFLQTGMLDPRAAKAFVPGIVKAAELASKGAPAASRQNQLNYYLNLCAFDMFSSFMFGEVTNCAELAFRDDKSKLSHESQENLLFCQAVIQTTEHSGRIAPDAKEIIANRLFGYRTSQYKEFYNTWGVVREIGTKKIHKFIDRYDANELDEYERNSYMANALERLGRGETEISKDEVLELCLIALFVGVDTTSGVTAWNLIHVALNPRVQENLHAELKEAVKLTGGLTAKTIERRNTPYLHAVLRENYRLTPPFGSIYFKRASQDEVVINQVSFPKNSMFFLKSKFNDTSVLEDAHEFRPERWLADAVEERSGTNLEEMDHPLLRDGFGAGARRCPGSRVATNEVLCMIAQLVLDYEIRAPPSIKSFLEIPYALKSLISPEVPKLEFVPRTQNLQPDSGEK